MRKLVQVYRRLLESFGPQDWWPVRNGFKPPSLEVCLGAVLTQNTSWRNVEKALESMKKAKCNTLEKVSGTPQRELERLVRSAGFYRQKAERVRTLVRFMVSKGSGFRKVGREELLDIKGIGPETADSILLYACNRPFFVIDAYTRRVFSRLGVVKGSEGYEELREMFEHALPRDADVYREYHALIVELGKRYCKKRPVCEGCPLSRSCSFKN